MVFNGIETRLVTEVNKLSHEWHCAAAQVTGWDETEELFEQHRKQANRAYNLIGKAQLPWYKWVSSDGRPLEEVWKAFQKSNSDPKYKEWAEKERQRLSSVGREAVRQMKVEAENKLKRAATKEAQLKRKTAKERRRVRA